MKKIQIAKIVLFALFTAIFSSAPHTIPAANADVESHAPANQELWPEAFKFAMLLQRAAVSPLTGTSSEGFRGFGSVVPNLRDGSVDIYWAGDTSPELNEFLDAQGSNLAVRIHSVEHNFEELALATIESVSLSSQISSASVLPDSSGISVQISDLPESAAIELKNEISQKIDMPVELAGYELVTPAVASRNTDSSPYSGGALFQAGTKMCSSGFGVVNNATQLKYILTAYHCFYQQASPTAVKASGSGATIGTWNSSSSLNLQSLDSSMYRPTGGIATNTVFVGGPTSTLKAGIYGALTNVVGMSVCTSGGNTGEHCTTVIDSLFSTIQLRDANSNVLYTVSNVVTGHVTTAGSGFAGGDSGGPVYGVDTSLISAPYRASGIITAGAQPQTCVGQPALSGSKCYATEYWVDAQSLFAALNLSIAP